MSAHTTGTRDEWLKARKELLEDEKELSRQTDELARRPGLAPPQRRLHGDASLTLAPISGARLLKNCSRWP